MEMIDASAMGRALGSVTFPVERGKLAELARAFHDPDPVWFDPDAARAAGFPSLPVPPTVTSLVDHWLPAGALTNALAIGADVERLLHGQAEWEYLAPVEVGQELTASSRVADISVREGKRGGSMTLATIETEFRTADGQVVVRRRDTLIETEGAA